LKKAKENTLKGSALRRTELYKMLKRTRPLRRSVEVEEGLAKSSNKQHGETMMWRDPGGS